MNWIIYAHFFAIHVNFQDLQIVNIFDLIVF